jgi:hypothetical protein
MINRIVLPALIAALVLVFFIPEVSGNFPALSAVICMAVLYADSGRPALTKHC